VWHRETFGKHEKTAVGQRRRGLTQRAAQRDATYLASRSLSFGTIEDGELLANSNVE